jgi:hypothetical protein
MITDPRGYVTDWKCSSCGIKLSLLIEGVNALKDQEGNFFCKRCTTLDENGKAADSKGKLVARILLKG